MTYRRKYPPGEYDPRAPRPHACGPRPHVWVTGPDPEEHKKYRVFIQQRNQANYRLETWTITFEEWWDIWEKSGHWDQRGCKQGQYCMSRIGDQGEYSSTNVFIQQHGQIGRAHV